MSDEQITISVDPEAARAYRSASEQDRRKLDLLLGLRIRDLAARGRPLAETMRDIARKARARGLNEDELRAILDGD